MRASTSHETLEAVYTLLNTYTFENLHLRELLERLPSERVRARTGQATLEAVYALLNTHTFENFWNDPRATTGR